MNKLEFFSALHCTVLGREAQARWGKVSILFNSTAPKRSPVFSVSLIKMLSVACFSGTALVHGNDVTWLFLFLLVSLSEQIERGTRVWFYYFAAL